jgi:hypothetical protein
MFESRISDVFFHPSHFTLHTSLLMPTLLSCGRPWSDRETRGAGGEAKPLYAEVHSSKDDGFITINLFNAFAT